MTARKNTLTIRALYLIVVSWCFCLSAHGQILQGQVSDTLKYIDKIPHWYTTYRLTAPDYLQVQRNQFKSRAFVDTYVQSSIDFNAWMFNLLNQFTVLRTTEVRNNPHIFFNVKFKPVDNFLTNYRVEFTIGGSPQVPLNFEQVSGMISSQFFTGQTFGSPDDARGTVESAINYTMEYVANNVGSSLAPDLMVKFGSEVFWNGNEIMISRNGDNQVTLVPLAKLGRPLKPEQVQWTNATGGVVDMTGQQSKTVTLSRTDTTGTLTVTLRRRTSLSLDIKSLLRPIVLEILQQKLAQKLDSIVNMRVDSVQNANEVSALLGQVEANNVVLEGEGTLVPLLAQPMLGDSASMLQETAKINSFRELRKRKRLNDVLRTKVNVAAFTNLLIVQPEKLDELLDQLLISSGTLLGELLLNINDPNVLQTSRNIVITWLNNNMTRLAGSDFGMAPDEPITVRRVQASTPSAQFDPAKKLYISNKVAFAGKAAFETEMNAYLATVDPPLYVFINYSQDVSTEAYVARSQGARPQGLPEGARFLTLSFVNIPGSVKYQVFASSQVQVADQASSAPDFLKDVITKVPHYGFTQIPTDLLNTDGRSITFISPAGTLVPLPSTRTKRLVFSYGLSSLEHDFVIPGTLLSFEIEGKQYTANAVKEAFAYLSDNGSYDPSNFLTADDLANANSSAIMMMPSSENELTLYKFSVTGLQIEKGDFVNYATFDNFPLKPFAVHQAQKKTSFKLEEVPEDLFDFQDHRQHLTLSVFDFLKNDYATSHLLIKLKACEYYGYNPVVFSNFYNEVISAAEGDNKRLRDILLVQNDKVLFWTEFLKAFRPVLSQSSTSLQALLSAITLQSTNVQWEQVLLLMGPGDYYDLTFEQRITLIKLSTKFRSIGNGDKWIRNLVLFIEEDEKDDMLNALVTQKNHANDTYLLPAILRDVNAVDGQEFTELVSGLVSWIMELNPVDNFAYETSLTNKRYIKFDPNFWVGDFLTEYFSPTGEVVLKTTGGGGYTLTCPPFEYLIIESQSDHQLGGARLTEGARIKMPALFAYMVFNNVNTQRLFKTARLALDVVMLSIGIGELQLAIQAGSTFRYSRAIMDLGVGIADLTFSQVLDQRLMQTPAGQEFLDAWGNIMLAYGVIRIGDEIFYAQMNRLNRSLSKMRQEGKLTQEELNELANKKDALGARVGAVVPSSGNLASDIDIQRSLTTILELKNSNKLVREIGAATDMELAAIHRYTENGNILLTSMRNGNETIIDVVNFTDFEAQLHRTIKSGLQKFRQTSRLETGTVIRGRTYTLADYEALFKSASDNVPLKGLISCTTDENVAIDFLTLSGKRITGPKVKVIMKIKSKSGVYIDDISDWGANLVHERHPGNLIQKEVLLEEGYFRKTSPPRVIKYDDDLTPWIEVEMEELGQPLRNID